MKLMPLIKFSGSNIPWHPEERKNAVGKILAMSQALGQPSLFLTVSPDPKRNVLALRIARGNQKSDKQNITEV